MGRFSVLGISLSPASSPSMECLSWIFSKQRHVVLDQLSNKRRYLLRVSKNTTHMDRTTSHAGNIRSFIKMKVPSCRIVTTKTNEMQEKCRPGRRHLQMAWPTYICCILPMWSLRSSTVVEVTTFVLRGATKQGQKVRGFFPGGHDVLPQNSTHGGNLIFYIF